MSDEMSQNDIDRQFQLRKTDPEKFLELMNALVAEHPDDPNSYFARHQAWSRLGQFETALADLDKSLDLEDHYVTHRARGRILHQLGRYQEAIEAFNRCERMEPAQWGRFCALVRADCHARLGNETAALADCSTMPDDHWTPGLFGAPAGNKQEVAVELRRRAAAARENKG